MNKNYYFGIFNSWDTIDEDIRKETREMLAECNDMAVDDVPDEWITDSIMRSLDDERMNLDIEIDGIIIAYADLGFWFGRRVGYKIVGSKIKNVLDWIDNCMDCEWYADHYNVRCTACNHDGRHNIVFRYVDNVEMAEKITNAIYNGRIETEQDFFKASKSIRPFVARAYGWKEYGKQKNAKAA